MTCSSAKRSYISHDAAMRAAREQAKRKGMVLNVYRCEECKQWHVTRNHQQRTLREEKYRKKQGEQS